MPVERRGWVTNVGSGQLRSGDRPQEEPDEQWKAAAFARWHEPDESRGSRPESVSIAVKFACHNQRSPLPDEAVKAAIDQYAAPPRFQSPLVRGPRSGMTVRRFPPPWAVEETDACFLAKDGAGQALVYVYFDDEPGRRSAAKLLTRD